MKNIPVGWNLLRSMIKARSIVRDFRPDVAVGVGTNNVKDMRYMFSECSSLSNLPDISKWNTNNVNNMSGIFYGCSSLSNLPDISKWNTNNVNDMRSIFSKFLSILTLSTILKRIIVILLIILIINIIFKNLILSNHN